MYVYIYIISLSPIYLSIYIYISGPKYKTGAAFEKNIEKKPRAIIFGSHDRFQKKQPFISREHLDTLGCDAPGPKYEKPNTNKDKHKNAPAHTFGANRVRDHGIPGYLAVVLKNSEPGVGPLEYDVTKYKKIGNLRGGGARTRFGTTPRFQNTFISHKHSKLQTGDDSPGPQYNPKAHTVETKLKKVRPHRV